MSLRTYSSAAVLQWRRSFIPRSSLSSSQKRDGTPNSSWSQWEKRSPTLQEKLGNLGQFLQKGGRNPYPCSNQKSCWHQSSLFHIHRESISLELEGPGRGDFPSNKTDFRFKNLRFIYVSFIQLNFHYHLRTVIITKIRRKENEEVKN